MTDQKTTSLISRLDLGEGARRFGSDAGLLVLRVAVGIVFIAHGWGDATQPGDAGANVENYRGAGIPLPEVTAYFGAYMQLLGGVALLVGVVTRLVALGLAAVMAGALIWVHPGEPIVLAQDGSGSGFAFIMFSASLALIGTGAGRWSVDGALASRYLGGRATG
ncbi:DoxX family protein [Microbacterium sp.]|uniref:DoxX family protein n=1 Tax=Microbacterium sp. TaxID=51671 RepID=UPI003C739FB4